MGAARARDTVMMMAVLGRCDEVKRWTLLTECWRHQSGRRGRFLREAAWGWSRGGRGQRGGWCG